MKLIEPYVEVIPMENPLIHIEKIGRVCYKSASDFSQETAEKFFNSLVKNGHHSVLEHATFIFLATTKLPFTEFIYSQKYLNVTESVHYEKGKSLPQTRIIVSGNLRAICESRVVGLLTALEKEYPQFSDYLNIDKDSDTYDTEVHCPTFKLISNQEFIDLNPTEYEINNHIYTSISFTTDRGVTHEMVRHRPASYSQESTRYCNYSHKKFGNELEFIKPATFNEWTAEEKDIYVHSLICAEQTYMSLLNKGISPQFARGVLPTDIRTQIVMTANHSEWNHFFNLRSLGITGKPHPNMKKVADIALLKYRDYYNIY